MLHDDRDYAITRLAALLKARDGTRGRQPKHVVDIIVAGPPRYADDDAWSDERINEWAQASYEWLRETFPSCPLAIVALHTDESSPHMHVVMIPETDDGRLSWTDVKPKASGQKLNHYRHIQDNYHERVAKRFGLDRGERGSTRKHKPLTREEGIARAREELETGRKLKRENEALHEHLNEVADAADRAGKVDQAHTLRRAADDPEQRIRALADRAQARYGKQARALFAEELRLQREIHDAEKAAAEKAHKKFMADLETKTEAFQQQIRDWEKLARKKPLGYGAPVAHAGG